MQIYKYYLFIIILFVLCYVECFFLNFCMVKRRIFYLFFLYNVIFLAVIAIVQYKSITGIV